MVQLKRMSRADIPAVAEIEKLSFADPWNEQTITESFDNENSIWLAGYEADGTLTSYLGGVSIAGEAEIYRVACHPDKRRGGFCEGLVLLMEALEEVETIYLEVRASNAPARALYEKCWFEVCGERKAYYENPTEDAILMRWEPGEGRHRCES